MSNLPGEPIRNLPSTSSTKNCYVEPYIVWENGIPKKKYKLVMAKEDIQEMKIHAATQMYHGEWDPINQTYIVDPRYEGLSKIEVAQHKLMDKAAAGDIDALSKIEDRILGKPKQQVESLQISATLESFLEKVAKDEGMVSPSPAGYSVDDASHEEIIEGEVVGYSPSVSEGARQMWESSMYATGQYKEGSDIPTKEFIERIDESIGDEEMDI